MPPIFSCHVLCFFLCKGIYQVWRYRVYLHHRNHWIVEILWSILTLHWMTSGSHIKSCVAHTKRHCVHVKKSTGAHRNGVIVQNALHLLMDHLIIYIWGIIHSMHELHSFTAIHLNFWAPKLGEKSEQAANWCHIFQFNSHFWFQLCWSPADERRKLSAQFRYSMLSDIRNDLSDSIKH